MIFWRICPKRFAAAALRGEGARLYGGRWNSRGITVFYASTSLSLAAIEYFVHLEPNFQPHDLVAVKGEIPAEVRIDKLDVTRLPPRWHATTDESLRHFGDDWVRAGTAVALLLPSAAVRSEWNVLLSPEHGDYAKLIFEEPEPFVFDARMFK